MACALHVCTQVHHELGRIAASAAEGAEPPHEHDRFGEVMGGFVQEGSTSIAALEASLEEMRGALLGLSAYLGDDTLPSEPEVVLVRLHAFATAFGKACRDNERQAYLAKKAQQDAAERAERQKRAEPAAAAGGGSPQALPSQRKMPLRRLQQAPGALTSSIQASLSRGEVKMLKQLQAQMSSELAQRMAQRRQGVLGASRGEEE